MAEQARQRYYVHGDENEKTHGIYYCDICDGFLPEEHFSCHMEYHGNIKRYEYSMEKLKKNLKNGTCVDPRINEVTNLFAHLKTPSESEFFQWLVKQIKRDDFVGDIARDAKADEEFPIYSSSKKEIESYLSFHVGTNDVVKKAFRMAWSEFISHK